MEAPRGALPPRRLPFFGHALPFGGALGATAVGVVLQPLRDGPATSGFVVVFANIIIRVKWIIFAGSALALVLAAAIGVMVGAQLERFISPRTLKIVAGAGFIAIGLWTIVSK